MKDDFNNLLDLIEKSINIEDQDILQNLESKILTLSTSLNDQIKNRDDIDIGLKALDMEKLNELNVLDFRLNSLLSLNIYGGLFKET